MRLFVLSVLTMTLLQPVRPSAGESFCASNRVPQIRVKQVQTGEKTVKLKAEVIADRGLLQIRQQEELVSSGTNALIAEIAVAAVGPCGFDFAMTPKGDLMWVFVQQISTVSRQPVCLVYPLGQEHGGKYVHRTRRRQAGGEQRNVPVSLDLTALLRHMAAGSFQKGKPLALGRDAHISNVQLNSTNAASVVVTGELGTNCSFRGTIVLGANDDIFTTDFAIESTKQKPPSHPK